MAKTTKSAAGTETKTTVRAPGLGFVVSTLSRRIIWGLAAKTKKHGVMPAQFPVLRCLNEMKESTQIELSKVCGIEQSSMAVTLARMEKSGLVQRRADDSDARRRLITLTAKGNQMLRMMTDSAHAVYERAVEGLTDEQIQMFLQLCTHMTENLQREVKPVEQRG
jgi:DNA-binding MarR family transcriptional regulator